MRTREIWNRRRELSELCGEVAPMLAPKYRERLKLLVDRRRAVLDAEQVLRAGNALIAIRRALFELDNVAAELEPVEPDNVVEATFHGEEP